MNGSGNVSEAVALVLRIAFFLSPELSLLSEREREELGKKKKKKEEEGNGSGERGDQSQC